MTSTTEPRVAEAHGDAAATPAIEARGLASGYPGSVVWSGADFSIEPGEFVAVLGPNGAGKTTLLRMLLGLLPPLAGELRVLGVPPRRGSHDIGYVPQAQLVDPQMALRATDLVGLGLDGHRFGFALPRSTKEKRRLVDEALSAVGLHDLAERPVGRLSGGERQRLFLAQALVSRPAILLLDEPLANLDVRNQSVVAALVRQVAEERGITVVLVAHDLNPLRQVLDRVCYVAGGGVAIGTPEEVVTGPVLSRLYGAPVEVLTDSRGRRFVVGLEEETAHPHGSHEPAGGLR
ncbi:MAG TPA: ATP-binding cassette domain-containing protein [Acidimicrobiales bacterium]|nr:ATP-binding cassette domain-containing protein [Acidimicrobiales bacterium]